MDDNIRAPIPVKEIIRHFLKILTTRGMHYLSNLNPIKPFVRLPALKLAAIIIQGAPSSMSSAYWLHLDFFLADFFALTTFFLTVFFADFFAGAFFFPAFFATDFLTDLASAI